jgi:cytoskeletal protein RodZ
MNNSIGKQLREAREARSLTLEQVSEATYMRLHYLQALEAGDFNSMPSSTQARGFLRTYANFLGLDTKALLASLEGESVPEPGQGAADEPTPEPKPEKIEGASSDAESALMSNGIPTCDSIT